MDSGPLPHEPLYDIPAYRRLSVLWIDDEVFLDVRQVEAGVAGLVAVEGYRLRRGGG